MSSLFHATYRRNLPSIKEKGLHGSFAPKRSFEFAKPHVVYLADNPMIAVGFLLEVALTQTVEEGSPSKYLDELVILRIPRELLHPEFLHTDEHVSDSYGCFEYHAVIPYADFEELSVDDISAFPMTYTNERETFTSDRGSDDVPDGW